MINLNIGMRGLFRARFYNTRFHTYRYVTDWCPNSMLLSGMNKMADFSNWAGSGSKCQVGTISVPAPTTNDTQLLGYLDGTATIVDHTFGAQPSAPYYGWDRTTYQFPAGPPLGEQNLQEAGVGWSTEHSPAALITRSLFTDGEGGNPTFTPLDDEIMQVQYELRYYPPLGDTLGTVTLNGILFDTISRAALVTQWGAGIGQKMGVWSGGVVHWKAYDGTLGEIWEAPDGLHADNDNTGQFNLGYINNSYQIDMQLNTGPAGLNLAAGMRSMFIITNAGFFQTQFTEAAGEPNPGDPVWKTTDFTMSLTWRLGWSEATIP